jgi:hypothetical protein
VSTQSNCNKSHQELLSEDLERFGTLAWYKHVVLTVRSYDQSWIMPSAEQPTNGRRQPYEPKDPIYDPYRRTDRYGIMGMAPQPWTEYARLILLGITLVPIKAVVCFGELVHSFTYFIPPSGCWGEFSHKISVACITGCGWCPFVTCGAMCACLCHPAGSVFFCYLCSRISALVPPGPRDAFLEVTLKVNTVYVLS